MPIKTRRAFTQAAGIPMQIPGCSGAITIASAASVPMMTLDS